MKRITNLLLIFISSISLSNAQPIVYDWAKSLGGKPGGGTALDMVRDPAGNIYMIGEYSGTRNFGPTISLTSIGSTEVFFAKYSSTGTCLWAKRGGANFATANMGGITFKNGFVYFSGSFYNQMEVDGNLIVSNGQSDIFLAKLDPANGAVAWLINAGGPADDYGTGITATLGGEIFQTGSFIGTALFGGQTLNSGSNSNADIFLAKWDANGTCLLAVKAGNPINEDKGQALHTRNDGNIILSGYYHGTATFGTITMTGLMGSDIFVSCYGVNGTPFWVQKGTSRGSDQAPSVSGDASGNTYITGFVGDTAFFGTIMIPDNGYGSVIVAKYDFNGVVQWVKSGTSFSVDAGYDISTDASGSSYVVGVVSGNANFSGTPLTGVLSYDGFVAKYNTAGTLTWVTRLGSTTIDYTRCVIHDTQGWCIVSGEFTSGFSIGSTALYTPAGDATIFLARMGGGTVGINENNSSGIPFNFYPNPASGSITFNLDKVKDVIFSIDILSIDGKIISSEAIAREQATGIHTLNTTGLSKGSYIVRMNTSEGDYSRTLIVN